MKRAIDCFNKAVAFNPQCKEAINNLAQLHHHQGNFEESINNFNKLSLENDSDVEILLRKAQTLTEHNRFADALECVEKSVKLCQVGSFDHISSLVRKANIYSDMDRYEEAKRIIL